MYVCLLVYTITIIHITLTLIHTPMYKGHPCPSNVNPAEYYIDLVSVDYSSPEAEQKSRDLIHTLTNTFKQSSYYKNLSILYNNNNNNKSTNKAVGPKNNKALNPKIKGFRPSLLTRFKNQLTVFKVLFIRAYKQVTRYSILY